MSTGTDRLMARLQTRRQGLKQHSLTTIVFTSGGCTGVTVEQLQLRARYCMRIWSRVRAIHKYKINIENLKKKKNSGG
jgi:hypothetical protein